MSANLISWLIVAEVALPFIVLSSVLILVILKKRKKNKIAVRQLIKKIKDNEPLQKENLVNFLTNRFLFNEINAAYSTRKIINERKMLFRNLISAFLDNNFSALESLDEDLSRVTNLYHALEITEKATSDEEVSEDESESSEEIIAELKKEIKTLKKDVHITLTTLNNIFSEFSSMFGEAVPENEMSVDQIVNAMETFSNKNSASESKSDEAQSSEPEATEQASEDKYSAVSQDETSEDSNEDEKTVQDSTDFDFDAADLEDIDSDLEDLTDDLDNIDSALDVLDANNSTEEEPDWGDAFEESGDTLPDSDKK